MHVKRPPTSLYRVQTVSSYCTAHASSVRVGPPCSFSSGPPCSIAALLLALAHLRTCADRLRTSRSMAVACFWTQCEVTAAFCFWAGGWGWGVRGSLRWCCCASVAPQRGRPCANYRPEKPLSSGEDVTVLQLKCKHVIAMATAPPTPTPTLLPPPKLPHLHIHPPSVTHADTHRAGKGTVDSRVTFSYLAYRSEIVAHVSDGTRQVLRKETLHVCTAAAHSNAIPRRRALISVLDFK